jgi:Na+-driven multidrug efflux pump
MLPLFAVRMLTSSLLQSVGKPFLGAFIAFSKQILIQLPAMLILAPVSGVEGILWAGPISDVVSFLFAIIVLLVTARKIFSPVMQTEAKE